MPQRRLLVIGSQCDILNKLDFLPEVAERLHALLRHPGPGGCEGVPLEGCPPGLLRNPTVEAAKKAIKTAIKEAAEAGATLILAYIGHGEFPDEMSGDFYLMPKDATVPTADEAIDFTVHIKDCIKLLRNRGSLIVLLDTCHAGAGAWQAMKTWAQSLRGTIDFDLLTATDDRATADAPLTRAVIELLERGDPEAPERIRCQDVHRLLKHRDRPSQHVAFNPDDVRLSLGRNIAHDPGDVFWKDSPERVEILRHTWYFQPTPQLAELVEASRSHPIVVLTGEAGAGKTSLAGALARPEITSGRVPDDFVHAIAILTNNTNQRSLADDLERQLRRSVPGFAGTVAEFERSVPLPQREALDFLSRKVLRPLAYLVGQPEVRIVLDGFDQLSDFTREAVGEALASRPGHLRLVITARPDTPGCPPAYRLDHGTTPRADLDRYLASRRIPDAARPAILDRASGHWLVASLLAQAVFNDPAIDLAQLPGTVNEAYTKLLDQARAADAWKQKFRPVLGPLAVAGAGSVLPLSLLALASKALGGPESVEDIRDVLSRLRGLVERRDAGDSSELVGLFHTTLAEYLLGSSAAEVGYAIDAGAVHRAMVQAIEALAPMAEHDRDDPLHRYAFLREADHLWALGDMERLLACLRRREAYSPRENLKRWRQWFPGFRERFDEDDPTILDLRSYIAACTGAVGDAPEELRLSRELLRVLGRDHPNTLITRLITRSNIAYWTGEVGDAREALRLFRELLPDLERVVGRDHPSTLTTRSNIAHWTGEAGDAREALQLFRELLPDQKRALGRDHPDTLTTRNNIAACTRAVGDAREALRLSRELLPDLERVVGRDHRTTLTTRNNIAACTRAVGDAREALRLSRELLPDRERVVGRDHPDTLITRNDIAYYTRAVGDAREALRLSRELLPDRERVLGRDHPDTLTTRNNIAACTRAVGDAREALRLSRELLPDLERVVGRDHRTTLTTRNDIACYTGAVGDAREALRLSRELLPDRERVVGRDHPDTLITRNDIACYTGAVGDAREALRLSRELLPDLERVVGRDHPTTLTTRSNIAHWTGEAGDAREALRLSRELLPDRERVLGRDHPDTLITRNDIAYYTRAVGDAREALRLSRELLPDQERVLGRDHPDTLITRSNIAHWTDEAGDAREALRLSRELLPDLERVLGRDHPDTLNTRNNIAACTGAVGDAREALRLSRELLPDQERVLGRDHPDTLNTLGFVGIWATKNGDQAEGCRRLHEGLTRAEARFGPNHSLTQQFQNAIRIFGCDEPESGAPVTPGPR